MPAPTKVAELVGRYSANVTEYRSPYYNETQTRREFIDPFFEALGWDIGNERGLPAAYKNVVHEDDIRIAGAPKRPDYSFRIDGNRKFFVEAKKPSIRLHNDAEAAFQLRRYGWSAKLPVSVVTNFAEFAAYDCRIKPDPTDHATTARMLYLKVDEYLDQWQKIDEFFSYEGVLVGELDAFAREPKKGTATVDAAFLSEIEAWRESLARNIALRNPQLSQRELNYAVQMTIDRIIFLRIAEDRGIERYGRLRDVGAQADIYTELCRLYQLADDRYNSGLFHFRNELGRTESQDDLTLRLAIDDRPLNAIIEHLYYPQSPYEFSVLPADILGHVYEQFLGKVIRLTSNHSALVEEKPEVRRAGGVYYTPTYIVDFIVEQTVGKLLDAKTPKQVAQLSILDPACGSGSFLLSAYQYLLDWYTTRYLEEGPDKHKNRLHQGSGGVWRLNTSERKRILLAHIYGVDIDPQAVEVTKLSLLLKVLEGESELSVATQLKLLHERALPDLSRNIKCGNSIISPAFVQMSLFDEEERYRINPFDWRKEFPAIISGGGFDAIVGNPPYLNIDDTWGSRDPRLAMIKAQFPEIYNDKTDILFYFLGRATELSRGSIGFIVSRAFLEAYKADKLRGYITGHSAVQRIIDLRNFYVFPGVGITTAIVILQPRGRASTVEAFQLKAEALPSLDIKPYLSEPSIFERITVPQSSLGTAPWVFVSQRVAHINASMDARGQPLGEILHIGQGMQTGRNDIFGERTAEEIAAWALTPGQYYKRAANSDIQRFNIRDRGEYLLYLEDVPNFERLPRGLQQYLLDNSARLKERAAYKRGDCDWWRYTWPLHKEWYDRPKILSPFLAQLNRFALDSERTYIGLTDTTVLFDNGQREDMRYFVGLLNSRLLTFRFQGIGKLKSAGIREYFWNSIYKLPIRRIDFAVAADVARHDYVVTLVTTMETLAVQLGAVRTGQDRALIERQIIATDQEVDQIVYALYGMTQEAMNEVEERARL